jgi:signal transduction histidine kinase
MGWTPLDLMPTDEAERLKPQLAGIVERREVFADLLNRNLHKDGHEVVLQTTGVPVLDSSGELLGFRGVDRDVTAQIQAQRILRDYVAELDTLLQVSTALARRGDLWDALQRVSEQASDLFEAENTLIFLFAEGLKGRHVVASLPEVEERLNALSREELVHEFGTLPLLNHSSIAAVFNDIEAMSDYPALQHNARAKGWARLLTVPLTLRSDAVGTVAVVRGADRPPFTDRNVEVLDAVASMIAEAIGHEQLRINESARVADQVRDKLARDLHDAVTQAVYSANLLAEALPTVWNRDPVEGRLRLLQMQRLIRSALAELRTLLHELRPATLATADLEQLIQRLGDALAGPSEIQVELNVSITEQPPVEVKVGVYRIAQEAFNNIAKYAKAKHVDVQLLSDDEGVVLSVDDDGVGFDPAAVSGEHMGLSIMRERAKEMGGELEIESTPGSGTHILVSWSRPGSMEDSRTKKEDLE